MIPEVRSIHRATKKDNRTIPHLSLKPKNTNSELKKVSYLLYLVERGIYIPGRGTQFERDSNLGNQWSNHVR
jgi:hypothetical protein